MFDQGVVSLGNFAVAFLLARCFARQGDIASFGAYGILMGLILFLNGVQAAMVVYPLTVRGAATSERRELGRMSGMSVLLTLMTWPVMGLCVLGAAAGWKLPVIAGVWAAVAMGAWQIQETLRRALMAHLRFRAAVIGDCITYVGQFLCVALLAWRGSLSLITTFQAIALATGVGALVHAALVGLANASWRELRAFAHDCWRLGAWILLGNITSLFTLTLFEWNIVYWHGQEMLGVYLAISNLLRLANPLSFAIATLIMPHAVRARGEEGMLRAKRVLYRFGALGVILLTPYLGLLLVAPKFSLAIFYGWGSAYEQHALALQVLTIATALTYGATVIGAFLNAIELGRYTFIAQIVYAAGFVAIGMPLTALYGLIGAAVGWFVASVLQAAISAWYAMRLRDEPKGFDVMQPVGALQK
jgi:O-antigen/teichoic acid export membrane protein